MIQRQSIGRTAPARCTTGTSATRSGTISTRASRTAGSALRNCLPISCRAPALKPRPNAKSSADSPLALQLTTPVVTLGASRQWMVGLPTGVLMLGTPMGIEIRSPVGTLVSAAPGSSFRPAVHAQNGLIAVGGGAQVRLLRASDLTQVAIVSPPAEAFIDARWAVGVPASNPQILAVRTAIRVHFFQVPTDLTNCMGSSCAVPAGSMALETTDAAGVSTPVGVLDWAVVLETQGPAVYAVDGSSSFFRGFPSGGMTASFVALAAYTELETSPESGRVYLADVDNSALATIREGQLLTIDRTVAGQPLYNPIHAFRVAPGGTYAYFSTPAALRVGNNFSRRAIFVGGLVP